MRGCPQVLLVDDSASNLKLYRHFLKAVQCVTDTAEDGVEAVAKATATYRNTGSADHAGSGAGLSSATVDTAVNNAVAAATAVVSLNPAQTTAGAVMCDNEDSFYLPYHVIIMDGMSLATSHSMAFTPCSIRLMVPCAPATHSPHAQYGWFASHTAN